MRYHNLAEMAEAAAGNWQKFDSFGWNRAWDGSLEDPELWTIVYTHNRDSGLLEQSNADAIEEIMKPHLEKYDPDIIGESHNHWACGWIDGYAIKVYNLNAARFVEILQDDENFALWEKYGLVRKEVTKAFEEYCEIAERLENYPVLDEEDFSRREYEDTIKNIESEGTRYLKDEGIPEDWTYQCWDWFRDNNERAIECRDDWGGYPSKEDMMECLEALDFLDDDYITYLEDEDKQNLEEGPYSE